MILKAGKEYIVQMVIRSPEFDIGEGEVDDILSDALNNAKLELVSSFPYMEDTSSEVAV